MPRQIIRVEVSTLQSNNIRSSCDSEALKRLGESLKKGQRVPILVSGKTIIDGHRRAAAAQLAGVTHLDAVDCEGMTPEQIREFQTVHAFHAEALSDYDRAMTLKAEKDVGLSNGQIAAKYDIDPATVSKLLSLLDCPPEAVQAAREGKIGVSKWYAVSRSEDPQAALRQALNGATRDELTRSNRKRSETAVRATKIKVPLPSGYTITVAGQDASLDEALEAVQEAARQIKAAIAKGVTAKSAMGYWRDIAAAS